MPLRLVYLWSARAPQAVRLPGTGLGNLPVCITIGRALFFCFGEKQARSVARRHWSGTALGVLLIIPRRRGYPAKFESGARLSPQLADVPLDRPLQLLVALLGVPLHERFLSFVTS